MPFYERDDKFWPKPRAWLICFRIIVVLSLWHMARAPWKAWLSTHNTQKFSSMCLRQRWWWWLFTYFIIHHKICIKVRAAFWSNTNSKKPWMASSFQKGKNYIFIIKYFILSFHNSNFVFILCEEPEVLFHKAKVVEVGKREVVAQLHLYSIHFQAKNSLFLKKDTNSLASRLGTRPT